MTSTKPRLSAGKLVLVLSVLAALWFGYRQFAAKDDAGAGQYRSEAAAVGDLSSSISATGTAYGPVVVLDARRFRISRQVSVRRTTMPRTGRPSKRNL